MAIKFRLPKWYDDPALVDMKAVPNAAIRPANTLHTVALKS